MKGARAALIPNSRTPVIDVPHVLVAAGTVNSSSRISEALKHAGYLVSTAPAGDVHRYLRAHPAIELLVFDGSDRPWIAAPVIDTVRTVDWALPIILVTGRDPEVRAEAARLNVEAILDAPVAAEEICRAATKLVPLIPEVELDVAW